MSDSENHKVTAATKLVSAGRRRKWLGVEGQKGSVVNPPVWRASTHLFEDCADLASGRPDEHGHFRYGRAGGPTQWALADALTQLEPGAHSTELYPSGVAALSIAMLCVLRPGDEVLVTDNAYGPTNWIALSMLSQFGVTAKPFDPLDLESFAAMISDKTKAVMLESPGSLTMEICDIPALASIARDAGAISIIDNTWATGIGFPALERGCDMSVMALTKHASGHSDVMMGSISAGKEMMKKVRLMTQFMGQVVSPDDAALVMRGLRTMGVRLEHSTRSATEIASWLQHRPEVTSVLCPLIPEGPGHAMYKRDFTGGCGLFSFLLKGDKADRARFIDALEHFGIGYSWGGYESLAIPIDPEHGRKLRTWPQGTNSDGAVGVRVSIGLEGTEDLIRDIEGGFAAMRSA